MCCPFTLYTADDVSHLLPVLCISYGTEKSIIACCVLKKSLNTLSSFPFITYCRVVYFISRGGSRILCQGGRKLARGLGTAYGIQRVQGRALVGSPPTGSSWVLSIQEAFPSTILKHFMNVMKCIKTHESSPKSVRQFLSSECKLKGDVT